jgi:hypothetical protein
MQGSLCPDNYCKLRVIWLCGITVRLYSANPG